MAQTSGGPAWAVHQLARQVIQDCTAQQLSLATCESITGGGIGWTLTSIPGSSAVFVGGLITYASRLKTELAGVDAGFIANHGVINEPTARQMAVGAAKTCSADIAISATGTAGPTGEDGVPPGVVWLGLSFRGQLSARCLRLTGDREQIRYETIDAALRYLLTALDHQH